MEIKLAKDSQEILDHLKVREIVFIDGQQVPRDLEHDGLDREATLIVAYLNSSPIGAGRYRLVDNYAKIERIAVLEEYRNLGIGKKIMEFIENEIRENTNIELLKLNSQCSAAPFYERLDYKKKGDTFTEAGIEHILMVKVI
ncbi:GNAT family N-acetyltransferase [Mycoplasmatota bacterium zrk1]